MEEIIKMDDMQKLASSLVDYMRGDGGVAVAYIDGSFESESTSERKRPLAILHTRNVVNRLKQELEDVFHRALDVSAHVKIALLFKNWRSCLKEAQPGVRNGVKFQLIF